jgi:hypothetical protein
VNPPVFAHLALTAIRVSSHTVERDVRSVTRDCLTTTRLNAATDQTWDCLSPRQQEVMFSLAGEFSNQARVQALLRVFSFEDLARAVLDSE